jgi:septal ring factor EnvC (AmiA/AmiB activator)
MTTQEQAERIAEAAWQHTQARERISGRVRVLESTLSKKDRLIAEREAQAAPLRERHERATRRLAELRAAGEPASRDEAGAWHLERDDLKNALAEIEHGAGAHSGVPFGNLGLGLLALERQVSELRAERAEFETELEGLRAQLAMLDVS